MYLGGFIVLAGLFAWYEVLRIQKRTPLPLPSGSLIVALAMLSLLWVDAHRGVTSETPGLIYLAVAVVPAPVASWAIRSASRSHPAKSFSVLYLIGLGTFVVTAVAAAVVAYLSLAM